MENLGRVLGEYRWNMLCSVWCMCLWFNLFVYTSFVILSPGAEKVLRAGAPGDVYGRATTIHAGRGVAPEVVPREPACLSEPRAAGRRPDARRRHSVSRVIAPTQARCGREKCAGGGGNKSAAAHAPQAREEIAWGMKARR